MYPADVWVLVTRAYLLGLDEGIRWSEDLLRRAQAKGDTEHGRQSEDPQEPDDHKRSAKRCAGGGDESGNV